ncbi:hypothetical protein RPN226_gp158 [Escherichia phage vB_EcoM-RPN226]|nr:hypothetical protein RPN226_gp158 [Escherichia phage vB_EcoM-RPN226]
MSIDIYKDKNGKLNKNWKMIHAKHPEIIDSIELPYDDPKTKIVLAINGMTELSRCKNCGVEMDISKLGSDYCSRKCSANSSEVKRKKLDSINLEERGKKISESLKGKSTAKSWNTRKKKYGEKGFSQTGIEAIKNNGVNSSEKRINTMITRYGVKNPFQLESVIETISKVQTENNTARNHLPGWLYDKNKFKQVYSKSGIRGIIKKSGCGANLAYVLSREYQLRDMKTTSAETEILSFINELGFEAEKTRQVIAPFELDIYVPEKKLAIEFNGLYWHSSGSKEQDIIKNNHLKKTEMCEAQGIHLLHIFENEWVDDTKREIWKSVIRNKLGKSERIYARKCKVHPVDSRAAKEFCEYNHLQGHVPFQNALGLFYNDELVQLVTFGRGRYQGKTELLRMCTKRGYSVVGGASKLLKDKKFISYANRRWSMGNVYQQIGMKQIGVTPPCDYYFDKGRLYHRSSYMKHLLKDKLKVFDENLSAIENCYNNKIRRIWDCGNIVYESQ